jgi:hypothetical protein
VTPNGGGKSAESDENGNNDSFDGMPLWGTWGGLLPGDPEPLRSVVQLVVSWRTP